MKSLTRLTPFVLSVIALAASAGAQDEPVVEVQVPDPDVGITSLEKRRQAQLATAEGLGVDIGFEFTDRLPESGVTFRNLVTEDNKRDFKATHYDHGNGVAVADVDGDERLDVYFVTQVGSNELWRNLGGGRFENVTMRAGVAVDDRISISASFADYDNDGDPDLFVSTVKMGNLLFQNDGKGVFRDVSKAAGVAHEGHSSGAVFLDYDNDGWLDLLVSNVGVYTTDKLGPEDYYVGFEDAFSGHLFPERTETSILYRNLGDGRFEDVSKATGLVDGGWSGDVTFVDLDRDRFPEVYLPNMQGDDHYWVNVEADDGRRFEDRSRTTFPRSPWGAMGVKFFDFNNDGKLDLYVTDMHSDMSREVGPEEETFKSVMMWTDEHLQGGADNIFGNAFWVNRGEARFSEASDALGLENYWPWGFSAADLNADGFVDLFVASSMSFPFRYGINSVFLNVDGKRFVPAEFLLGVEPRREGRTVIPWFELDCSGGDKEHHQCEGRDGRVRLLGTLGTRSSAVFDLDDDGDLDIVTNEFFAEPQVLVSDLAERRPVHFLQVRLKGTTSNRDGLGARVTVRAGDDAYTRYHDGKSGYLSQSSMPMYFGLGDHEKIDSVTVEWPSGIDQTLADDLAIDRLLEITEPGPTTPQP